LTFLLELSLSEYLAFSLLGRIFQHDDGNGYFGYSSYQIKKCYASWHIFTTGQIQGQIITSFRLYDYSIMLLISLAVIVFTLIQIYFNK